MTLADRIKAIQAVALNDKTIDPRIRKTILEQMKFIFYAPDTDIQKIQCIKHYERELNIAREIL